MFHRYAKVNGVYCKCLCVCKSAGGAAVNGVGVLLLFAAVGFPVISRAAVSLGLCLFLSESVCVHVILSIRFPHAYCV